MKIFKKPTDFAHSKTYCQQHWHSNLLFQEKPFYLKVLNLGTNFVTTNTELLILMKIGFKLHSF